MTRRKLVAAALFFTAFGAFAYLPPLVLLLRLDIRVMGVPIETVYVFALWAVLVAGACWFSRALPDDGPHEGPHDRLHDRARAERRPEAGP